MPITNSFKSTINKPAQSTQPASPDDTSIRSLSFRQREQIIKQIYDEILGIKPTYKEIDKFAYSDITPNQIRLKLIKSPEFQKMREKASMHNALNQKVDMLKSELKQVLWLIRNIQKQLDAKDELIALKKEEISKLREFLRKLGEKYPEGPTSFFYTIYKTEYTQILTKDS